VALSRLLYLDPTMRVKRGRWSKDSTIIRTVRSGNQAVVGYACTPFFQTP
jgi:hypothetical protein